MPVPYWHHGICASDSDVVEFGGGDLWDKGRTLVRKVSFEDFRQHDHVEAVSHPITWSGLSYSPLLPPEQVIDRAEWLIRNQPPPYRLGYRNCESVAIWCATGDYESFQVKAFMRWRVLLTPLIFLLLPKKPSVGKALLLIGIATSVVTAFPYMHSRAFFDHTRQYPGLGNWSGL